ncbi:MAG: modification methylase [Candidatus Brocadiaceae bacterium]|nr:modification methylase [Candidatus Brocadiaceae bacterium]
MSDLEDAVDFHFIRQPGVESKLKTNGKNVEIQITRFQTNYLEEETVPDLENFESLSGDSKAKQTIPEDAKSKNPRVINANNTLAQRSRSPVTLKKRGVKGVVKNLQKKKFLQGKYS